eukprot:gnl/Chilomastix_cuspidata/3690.p1 GENE.gnl/Chilomastix_cuspidata/3690~~gnl/Chilomastix_cuspidata/3690.p1  ORF type:complete len:333 (-),score=119.47 gnl/Chilomastix_cuspidata/3690:16-1014(-)
MSSSLLARIADPAETYHEEVFPGAGKPSNVPHEGPKLASRINLPATHKGLQLSTTSSFSAKTGAPLLERSRKPLATARPCHEHDYDEEVIRALFEDEKQHRADPKYLAHNPKLSEHMVHVVIDWMLEVCIEFKLGSDTFFLACNLFHRVLSARRPGKDTLQLVAVTCLFVAAKVEVPRPPSIARFSFITDYTFSKAEILAMEAALLASLGWAVCVATQRSFIRLFGKMAGVNARNLSLMMYLSELSLRDTSFLRFRSSEIVTAALMFSVQAKAVPAAIARITGYTAAALRPCREALLTHWRHCTEGYKSTSFAKFSRPAYFRVSMSRPPTEL